MFRRLRDAPGRAVSVTVDGRVVEARAGDTVAAVLIAEGIAPTRVCFECLVAVDGVGNRQGCLVPVSPGMAIETQKTRREAGR
jgi:predicted molibdopterin-dependent oxidoreductase YjgC